MVRPLSYASADRLDGPNSTIDLADEIIVVSEDGYYGSSTHREIAYASAQGKRVRYWQNS